MVPDRMKMYRSVYRNDDTGNIWRGAWYFTKKFILEARNTMEKRWTLIQIETCVPK